MPSLSRHAWRLVLLSGAVCPSLALAQAPTPVDTVVVTAAPNPEDPPPVAAARKRLSETPGAVSVIAAESYGRRTALALDDVLRDAPGVFAQKKFGGDIRISIRGSGIGNQNHNRGLIIAQDGLPLNEADGFGDSQSIDPLIARFTEVYRGGNALRLGGALLGGAINVVTPTGRDAPYRNLVRLDGGSFGLARQHLAVARQAGDWDLYAAATNQTAQGERPQSQQNIQFATLSLGRQFGEDREVRLILGGATIAQEIAGALTLAQFRTDPRQPAAGNYANDQGRNQRVLRGSLRTSWRLDETTVLEAGAYATWKDLDHPIFQVIDQQSRNYGAFARLDWAGKLGGLTTDAFAGLWLRKGDLDSNFYVNRRGARGTPTSVSLQNADAADVFAEGRLFVRPGLALVGGGTWGQAKRDYRSFAVSGAPATFNLARTKTYDWFAPRAGLLWEAPDGAQVFANVTRSVEPPNFGALTPTGTGFAPVTPQKAWTLEAGTRGRRGPFVWDITAYRARLRDELLMFAVAPDRPAVTFNADRTLHQGLEAALDWTFAPGLRLRQSYTWSDFRFEDDSQFRDNRLPVTPEHLYRAELRYDHPAGWFAAPSVEWVPTGAWTDFANTRAQRPEGYAVLNLNGGVSLNPRLSLYLDIRNLLDKAYISNAQPQVAATTATAAYWPGDGRTISGGLTWAF